MDVMFEHAQNWNYSSTSTDGNRVGEILRPPKARAVGPLNFYGDTFVAV